MNGTYEMTAEQRVEWEAEVRSLYDSMVRIVVKPTWAKLIDFQETLPSLWVPVIRSPHATWEYSWISPPSRSRRTTPPPGTRTASSPGTSGGACPKARCGRWVL